MKNVIKYIILPSLLLVIFIVSFVKFNIEAFNYELSWGGNKGKWIYSDSGYIYPNKSINLKAGDSLRYNGVTVTSGTGGGGIAASDNTTFTGNNTLSGFNTFSGITRHTNGTYFVDSLNVTGAILKADSLRIVKNLLFGNSSKMYTVANVLYGLENKFEWQTLNSNQLMTLDSSTGLVIRKNIASFSDSLVTDSKFYFNDTVKLNSYTQITGNAQVSGNLNVGTNIITVGNITADSIAGIGKFITDVNAATLKGQDTTKFARTDTLTTEGIKGIWNFWNTVRFYTTVTFDVSPVFSALVNFANGINVTGTATFNGDLVPTWVKNQSSLARDQYEKVKIVRVPLVASPPYVATTFTVAHGITNWRTITGWTCLVQEDSLNSNINANVYSTDGATTNVYYSNASVDSINVRIRIPAAAVNLFNDTAKFRITFSDYDR